MTTIKRPRRAGNQALIAFSATAIAALILAACTGIGSHCDVVIKSRSPDKGCSAEWICDDARYFVKCEHWQDKISLGCLAYEGEGRNQAVDFNSSCDHNSCADADQIADLCSDAADGDGTF